MSQSSETSPTAKPPWRRWFQFSLRTLLIFVMLTACSAFAWRAHVEPYRRQWQTMALIEQLGGSYQTTEAPSWLRRLSGDTFQKVVLVNLADSANPNAYIDAVAALPALETLIVGRPEFTDQHLRRLHGLKTLRGLVLDCTEATDEGLAALREALPRVDAYHSQRGAIASLREVATVDAELNTSHSGLQSIIGDEWFEEVTRLDWFRAGVLHVDANQVRRAGRRLHWLDVAGTDVKDAGLAQLAGLRHLRWLDVGYTQVSDAGLPHLARLDELQTLDLSGSRVTDVGLSQLDQLRGLQSLLLADIRVGDAGLARLQRLIDLRRLDLSHTKVTDTGLADLTRFRQLWRLDLDSTGVSDAGMVHLKDLHQLHTLSLSYTRVGDAGLAALRALSQLERLSLAGTRVTDAALSHIEHLKNLTTLDLYDTKVTPEGVNRLQASLPACLIRPGRSRR